MSVICSEMDETDAAMSISDGCKRQRHDDNTKHHGANGSMSQRAGERYPTDTTKEELWQRFIGEGFSKSEIAHARDQMWERELCCDDYSEVLKFLRRQRKMNEQRGFLQGSSVPEEETKTISTAESTSAVTCVPSEAGNGLKRGGDDESISKQGILKSRHEAQQKKTSTQPLNITAKLDLVADYENLADAAFALSEWVAQAADALQIESLCSTNKSRALPTLIRRTIAETPDQIKFDDSILPSVLHLVGSIFVNAGMSSNAVSATRKSLEAVMHQSRRISLKKMDPDQELASGAARHIVSRIAQSVRELKSHGSNDGGHLIFQLEDEIESIISSRASSESEEGIVELVTRRDANKTATEKSSAIVSLVMGTDTRGFHRDANAEPGDEGGWRDEILHALLGSAGVREMESNRLAVRQLKERVEDTERTNMETNGRLKADLRMYQAERRLVADRMEELRRAMKQLEEDDAELCERITDCRAKIADSETRCNEEFDRLNDELAATEDMIEHHDTVDSLADKLRSYDESLKEAVAVSGIFDSEGDLETVVMNKFDAYLLHACDYFSSEAKCLHFLRDRVRRLEKEERDLSREIKECMALGMSATVSQMTDTLTFTRQNINDDKAVIGGLHGEAQEMLDNMNTRLEQYTVKQGDWQLRQLNLGQTTLLRRITDVVEDLDLGATNILKWIPLSSDLPTVVTTSCDAMELQNCIDSTGGESSFQGTYASVDDATRVEPFDAPGGGDETDSFVEESQIVPTEADEPCSVEISRDPTPPTKQPTPQDGIKNDASNTARSSGASRSPSAEDTLKQKLTWARPGFCAGKSVIKSLRDIQKEELSIRENPSEANALS